MNPGPQRVLRIVSQRRVLKLVENAAAKAGPIVVCLLFYCVRSVIQRLISKGGRTQFAKVIMSQALFEEFAYLNIRGVINADTIIRRRYKYPPIVGVNPEPSNQWRIVSHHLALDFLKKAAVDLHNRQLFGPQPCSKLCKVYPASCNSYREHSFVAIVWVLSDRR